MHDTPETTEDNMSYDDSQGPTQLDADIKQRIDDFYKAKTASEVAAHPGSFDTSDPCDEPPGTIHQRMAAIMADCTAIGKDQVNQQQRFKFRGIDDVYNALHKIMAKHEVFVLPKILHTSREERTTSKGAVLAFTVAKIRYTFTTVDGSSVDVEMVGEGMDSGDKSTSKACAICQKYALLQTFLIPTEDAKDPDAESHEVASVSKDLQNEIHDLMNKTNSNNAAFFDFVGVKSVEEMTPAHAQRAIAALSKKLKMQSETK